jgi:hypothetical protein
VKIPRTIIVGALSLPFIVPAAAFGQWAYQGTRAFYNAGNVGIGTSNPAHRLDVRSPGSRAISGLATASSGAAYGVYGQSNSTTGRGVFGFVGKTSGASSGVYGLSRSTSGRGVYGAATAETGMNFGVYGRTMSGSGRGVYGLAHATSGTNFGVYGVSRSSAGRGVFGWASATSGGAHGVYGRSDSAAGAGVFARNASGNALTASTDTGIGAYASANDAGGNGIGVWGQTLGVDGIGIAGVAQNMAGTSIGVYGFAMSGSGYAGVFTGRSYFVGSVGIGTPNPTYMLHLGADSAAKPGANTWTISSDERLKMDVTPLENSLDRLLKLRGVSFRWIDPEAHGGRTGVETGLIAQEVEEVFPEWVGADASGYKTLTVGGFEALAAEALRELRAEKDSQIAQQQRQIDSLSRRIEVLEELLAEAIAARE